MTQRVEGPRTLRRHWDVLGLLKISAGYGGMTDLLAQEAERVVLQVL